MIEVCLYNRFKDLQKVIPHLTIDLGAALRTGIVKDTGVEPEYNGIEDCSQITGRVQDVFQAIEVRNSVLRKEITRVSQSTDNSDDLPN